jgi:hypothetical protein
MSEAEQLKKECLTMAVAELELLMNIIGDLGFPGYRVSLCRLKGYSYGQCARNAKISKSLAQWYWETCQKRGYDVQLKQIFKLQ